MGREGDQPERLERDAGQVLHRNSVTPREIRGAACAAPWTSLPSTPARTLTLYSGLNIVEKAPTLLLVLVVLPSLATAADLIIDNVWGSHKRYRLRTPEADGLAEAIGYTRVIRMKSSHDHSRRNGLPGQTAGLFTSNRAARRSLECSCVVREIRGLRAWLSRQSLRPLARSGPAVPDRSHSPRPPVSGQHEVRHASMTSSYPRSPVVSHSRRSRITITMSAMESPSGQSETRPTIVSFSMAAQPQNYPLRSGEAASRREMLKDPEA